MVQMAMKHKEKLILNIDDADTKSASAYQQAYT